MPSTKRRKRTVEPQNQFHLKFAGRLEEVDAATLGRCLLDITTIIEEVNKDLKTGDKLDIRVKGTDPGSFWLLLGLEPRQLDPLIALATPDNIGLAKASASLIISTVTGLFKLRKLLNGETPKAIESSGDEVQIVTGSGNTVTYDKRTFNIYINNPKVDEKITDTFKTLESDPNIDGFEIADERKHQMFEVDRNEFKQLAKSGIPKPRSRTPVKRATLYIKKLDFDRELVWGFLYAGNKISAYIVDETFYERIDKGEKFSKGDSLEVELEITQELDPSINAYENKSYRILKVYHHIPREEQSVFDFSNEDDPTQ
jgi:hypothetical protein